jgi:hypothetical protein
MHRPRNRTARRGVLPVSEETETGMRQLGHALIIALLALGLTVSGQAFAKKARARRAPQRQAGQIACTIEGCHRIPPECHPEMGYTIDGIPTGFDIVVCPAPGRR